MSLCLVSHANSNTRENQLRVAFLYQFTKFIQWPEKSDGEMTIGILGELNVDSINEKYRNKQSQGNSIRFVKLTTDSKFASCCEVIYFDHQIDLAQIKQILDSVQTIPILVVGNSQRFIHEGGILSFVKKGIKLKFHVNLRSAQDKKLKLSSELLKIGIVVSRN